MPKRKNRSIEYLEQLAQEVLKLKTELAQTRPIIIEFCGTPNSGKTTTINSLHNFFKRNDYRVAVIQEMAAISPVKIKTHYFFNSWTLFASLAETIKQLSLGENKLDIVLIDRSVFDALCWFEWLSNNPEKNGFISKTQFDAFKMLLIGTNMWTYYIDLVYIFKARPERSLDREFSELLTEKKGTIMNEKVLQSFNESIDIVTESYGKHFRRIEQYDTSDYDPSTVSFDVTNNILITLKDLLTEKVGYFLDTMKLSLREGVNDFNIIASRDIFFGDRSMVELEDYIQPVAIAVITNPERNKVLVLRKNEHKTEKNSPEYKRLLLYLGGHARIEDKTNCNTVLEILRATLTRELKEELNETITVDDTIPFLIYTPTTEKSKRHIAVCFVIEMDLEYKVFRPTADEFILKSSTTKSGTVIPIKDLLNPNEMLEPWGEEILKYVFRQQRTLFDDMDILNLFDS